MGIMDKNLMQWAKMIWGMVRVLMFSSTNAEVRLIVVVQVWSYVSFWLCLLCFWVFISCFVFSAGAVFFFGRFSLFNLLKKKGMFVFLWIILKSNLNIGTHYSIWRSSLRLWSLSLSFPLVLVCFTHRMRIFNYYFL